MLCQNISVYSIVATASGISMLINPNVGFSATEKLELPVNQNNFHHHPKQPLQERDLACYRK